MLNLIGLGLGSLEDITLKGLKTIRKSQKVFLEHYTSVLPFSIQQMQEFYKKKIHLADRQFCQLHIDQLLDQIQKSENKQYSLLIVGDPFTATTHVDLVLRAKKKGIQVNVIHNAGIIGVVGCSGMYSYRFGQTVSIPFFTNKWRPLSFYNKISNNLKNNLHTLCLLDIKLKQRSQQNILKDKKEYQKPRFMTINQAIQQILYCQSEIKDGMINLQSKGIGLCRIGSTDQNIISGSFKQLKQYNFGAPLHSLIICSKLHMVQAQMFDYFRIKK